MKKISLSLIAIIATLNVIAQDSSKLVVSIPVAYKDVKFVYYFIYNNDDTYGDLRDTIISRYRPGVAPSDNSTSIIGAEVGTWLALLQFLRMNPDALKAKHFERIDNSLKLLVSQTYLIRHIAEQDAADNSNDQIIKQLGNLKIKRSQQ